MEAFEELRRWEKHCRFYRISSEIEDSASMVRAKFAKRFGEDLWQDCCKLVTPGGKSSYPVYAAKPIIKWGASDTSIFEKRWNIVLPGWMEEFYSKVSGMMLPMLNQVYVMPLDEAVYKEEVARESANETQLPYRLIRFADAADDGTGFSLRQRIKDGTWHVILTSGRYSTAEYQSEKWENVRCDNDINDWLLRMLRTDGHPLRIGNEGIEPMPYSREKDSTIA